MLEAGLSLIAASLPTLSYLITHNSLQSALRSVLSKISLQSILSTRRTEDTMAFSGKEASPYTETGATDSTGSLTNISKSKDQDTYEFNDLDQGVYVKHEVQSADNMV